MPCFLGRPARWRSCVSGQVSPDEPDGARAPRQPSAGRSASDGRESGDSVSDGQFRKHRWLPSPTERATDPTEPPACGAAAAAGPSTCTCPPALSGPRVQPPGGAIGPWPGAPPLSPRRARRLQCAQDVWGSRPPSWDGLGLFSSSPACLIPQTCARAPPTAPPQPVPAQHEAAGWTPCPWRRLFRQAGSLWGWGLHLVLCSQPVQGCRLE